MKQILLILMVLVFTAKPLEASADSLYSKGNNFYQEGKFEEATECYKLVIASGFESSTLYYNLGNSCFRSNKLGEARLYYEKSLKLNPSDEDANVNIQYLQGLLADRFEEVPVIFYRKWINSLFLLFSSNQWAYISIISFFLSAISYSIYLLMKSGIPRKAGFYCSLIFLFITLTAFTASWKQYKLIRNPGSGVIIELSVNVKSAPRETGTGLFVLHEGAKVSLEDKTTGWLEIRLSDGRKGWVPQESISAI